MGDWEEKMYLSDYDSEHNTQQHMRANWTDFIDINIIVASKMKKINLFLIQL
jgi:hypothetical protein